MFPTLKPGQIVEIINKLPKQGDIIIFFNKQNLVIHRYSKVFGHKGTKGDNNEDFDSYPIKSYVGVVKYDEHNDKIKKGIKNKHRVFLIKQVWKKKHLIIPKRARERIRKHLKTR